MKQSLLIVFLLCLSFGVNAQTRINKGEYATFSQANAACIAVTGVGARCSISPHSSLLVPGITAVYATFYIPWNDYTSPSQSILFAGHEGHYWRYYSGSCPPPKVANEISGLCEDPPPTDPCPPGQVTGPGGICTANPDPDEIPCKNVLGYVNGVEVCQDDRDECEALGGTYGIIMDEAGCLLDDEEPDLECESELFTFGNEYGGYVCVHPDPKNPGDDTPDPGVECPPGYSLAGGSCVIDQPNPEGDDDEDGTPNDEDGDDDGDGVPDARDPGRGAGQCDPTSLAYAECIGQLENASSTLAEDIKTKGNRAADSATSGFVTVAKGAIGNGDSNLVEPTTLVDEVEGMGLWSDAGACSDLVWTTSYFSFEVTCAETQTLRDFLFFACATMTILSILAIGTEKPPA